MVVVLVVLVIHRGRGFRRGERGVTSIWCWRMALLGRIEDPERFRCEESMLANILSL